MQDHMTHEDFLDTLRQMNEEAKAEKERNKIKAMLKGSTKEQRAAILMVQAQANKEQTKV